MLLDDAETRGKHMESVGTWSHDPSDFFDHRFEIFDMLKDLVRRNNVETAVLERRAP